MLTRIRNASRARHAEVLVPSSKLKAQVARILVDERERMTRELARLEWIEPIPSQANFFMVSLEGRTVQPVYLDQLSSVPAEPSLTPVVFPDLNGGPPHLSYAVQWIIFSLCVLAGWALAVRKSVHNHTGRSRKRRKALIPEQYL